MIPRSLSDILPPMASLTVGTLMLALVLSSQGMRPGVPVSSTIIPGSARTLIQSVVTTHPDGRRIELLLVWRGTPGWFLKSGARRSSGGGSAQSYSSTDQYGETEVSFEYVGTQGRRVILPNRSVDLGDHNVVLVDDVDATTGLRFLKSLRIDPGIDDPQALAPAIARSPELVEFLQCGVQLESVSAQRTTGGICDALARIR